MNPILFEVLIRDHNNRNLQTTRKTPWFSFTFKRRTIIFHVPRSLFCWNVVNGIPWVIRSLMMTTLTQFPWTFEVALVHIVSQMNSHVILILLRPIPPSPTRTLPHPPQNPIFGIEIHRDFMTLMVIIQSNLIHPVDEMSPWVSITARFTQVIDLILLNFKSTRRKK